MHPSHLVPEHHENPFHPVAGERDHMAVFHAPSEETVVVPRRDGARYSIQEHMRHAFRKHPSTVVHRTEKIKVVPYVDCRQVLGLYVLVIWPILLGIIFNFYGFQEVSEYYAVVRNVQAFQERVEDVQKVIDDMLHLQQDVLQGLLTFQPGASLDIKSVNYDSAIRGLQNLDVNYPEISLHHKRVTPSRVRMRLGNWKNRLSQPYSGDPDLVATNISSFIQHTRNFFAAYHLSKERGGKTWNVILQQIFLSEVQFRLTDTDAFGRFAYDGPPISERLRMHVVKRYRQALNALRLYNKYALPDYQLRSIRSNCRSCNWTGYRNKSSSFWIQSMHPLLSLDNLTTLTAVRQNAIDAGVSELTPDSNASIVFSSILRESMYAVGIAHKLCADFASEKFDTDLFDSIVLFSFVLILLIAIIILALILLTLFGSSLISIFSESYRFQWIQLCRRRAIEREKSRSDKIVAEMFFEVNFKYLYEGTLPPVVLYNEATVAFVELMQYEELCKIYNTAEHVALLDWYYHLVSNAVKGFNCNVVATAGHYCLLAGTHAYHAQNVALAMLRLMTLTRESFLPLPHNTRLPLIKAGIHTGSLAGAILSLKFPLFTMLGDTVNTASRMNSKSKPYRILLSEVVYDIVASNFETKVAGTFDVKGKGSMKAFWLLSCHWRAFVSYHVDLAEAEQLTTTHTLHQERESLRGHARTAFGQTTHDKIFGSTTGAGRHSSTAEQSTVVGIGGMLLQGLLRAKGKKRKHETKSVRRITYQFPTAPVKVEEKPVPPPRDSGSLTGGTIRRFFMNKIAPKPDESNNDPTRLSAKVDVKTSPHESYYIQVSNSVLMRTWKPHG